MSHGGLWTVREPETWEIVTPAVPALLSVTGRIALCLINTSPKLKLAGLDVN